MQQTHHQTTPPSCDDNPMLTGLLVEAKNTLGYRRCPLFRGIPHSEVKQYIRTLRNKSIKVQTLGELCMCGTTNKMGWVFSMRLLVVSR